MVIQKRIKRLGSFPKLAYNGKIYAHIVCELLYFPCEPEKDWAKMLTFLFDVFCCLTLELCSGKFFLHGISVWETMRS